MAWFFFMSLAKVTILCLNRLGDNWVIFFTWFNVHMYGMIWDRNAMN